MIIKNQFGEIVNNKKNIEAVLEVLREDSYKIASKQLDFLSSLEVYYLLKGKLSDKQFNWLLKYYYIVMESDF